MIPYILRREYEEEQEEEEARRRVAELKSAELWLSHEEIRNLSKKPEPNVHVEQFQKSQHWARLLQEGMGFKVSSSNINEFSLLK